LMTVKDMLVGVDGEVPGSLLGATAIAKCGGDGMSSGFGVARAVGLVCGPLSIDWVREAGNGQRRLAAKPVPAEARMTTAAMHTRAQRSAVGRPG
jgi:hypothetical protein